MAEQGSTKLLNYTLECNLRIVEILEYIDITITIVSIKELRDLLIEVGSRVDTNGHPKSSNIVVGLKVDYYPGNREEEGVKDLYFLFSIYNTPVNNSRNMESLLTHIEKWKSPLQVEIINNNGDDE